MNVFKAITILCILISVYALYTNGLLIRIFGEEGTIVIDRYANEIYESLPEDTKIFPLPLAPKTINIKHSKTLPELEIRVAALESQAYMTYAILQVIIPLIIPAIMYRFRARRRVKDDLKDLFDEKNEKK